ncbi:2Fe-2S iron-sulfur cluster-binding protein [Shewanella sairae]|uniref:2Fe-2S iron-sulfur cluster-binding protein n=1 Tax=Shewanella sairae TaxID=190310 RepID=UPI001C7E4F15|nr:2Fe-2S iron-sulfur cluster-binding protein [Shewanella sairae]MCL1131845.1 2Fe-2S iron-sulfur cluster-binding protein [Shewanella sairae]
MKVFSLASIVIDNRKVLISPQDTNLVEVAARLKINIPAPCLNSKRRNGCCKACLVEINGSKAYACATKPLANMQVTVRTQELDSIRKASLRAFKAQIRTGKPAGCQCSGTC